MKRQGCLLKLAVLLALIAIICLAAGPSPVAKASKDCVEGQYWVDADGARTDILPAYLFDCIYTNGFPLINRAGECGRPKDTQPDLMIYGPNGSCTSKYCNSGPAYDGIARWPALSIGAPVTVCVDGTLYRGKVFDVIPDADSKGILPQTPFECKTGECGSLTTGAGTRPHYTVTRFWATWSGLSAGAYSKMR